MPAAGKKGWDRFPQFVQYANGRDHFQDMTQENLQWAQNLSLLRLKRSGGRLWPPETAWYELGAHLPIFQQFLDAIIGSHDKPALITREMMQGLTEHCAHVVRESRWDGRPEEIREQEVQLETLKRPAQKVAIWNRLAGRWGVPVSELPMDPPPPVAPQARYREVLTSRDPLDEVYWDLREFLLRDQGERLRKCPVCQRYFVQVTARVRTYCDTPCRLTASPTRRARNAEYQQQYQERRIHDDLQKVRRAKDQLWKTGVPALELSWVCERAGISSRRWTSLRQWEIGQYGKPQVTDLTRRARLLARSG